MHIVPDVHSSHENEEPAEQSRLRKAIKAPWLGPILIVIGWGPLFAFGLVFYRCAGSSDHILGLDMEWVGGL
jgi:hypothetical protein